MAERKFGSRHPLLFYRRTMDRVWKITFVLGLVLAAVWRWSLLGETMILGISSRVWFLAIAALSFFLSAFAFMSRFKAYVQVHRDYLSVVTPFLGFRVSYRRMRTAYPVLLQQLFPPNEARRAERQYLEPFYGKTVIVVEMRGFPIDPRLLKLFLPSQMFSPRANGLVFLVPDWMGFSTELDSFHGTWMQAQRDRAKEKAY
ncbi:MAG: hypothetical protein AB1894_22180 [Chloroflexota bacterium]